MAEIVVAGELLAEFGAARRGQDFAGPGKFTGPFPSGAPAIFADQAARLGTSVGCVGRDAIVARLASHGVSIDAIRRVAGPTGLALSLRGLPRQRQSPVRLQHRRQRLGSAGGRRRDGRHVRGCRYYHVMGSSPTSENAIAAVKRGVIEAARVGAKISFDPNVRAEMLAFKPMRAALEELLGAPATCSCTAKPTCRSSAARSRPIAACWFTPSHGSSAWCSSAAARPAAAPSTARARSTSAGYETTEIDPTGAGDCFGVTLLANLIQGWPIEAALSRANAAGALAVARVGPIEGNSARPPRSSPYRVRYRMSSLSPAAAQAAADAQDTPGAILAANPKGAQRRIYSVCSAHALVLEAAFEAARDDHSPLLIEATPATRSSITVVIPA